MVQKSQLCIIFPLQFSSVFNLIQPKRTYLFTTKITFERQCVLSVEQGVVFVD